MDNNANHKIVIEYDSTGLATVTFANGSKVKDMHLSIISSRDYDRIYEEMGNPLSEMIHKETTYEFKLTKRY